MPVYTCNKKSYYECAEKLKLHGQVFLSFQMCSVKKMKMGIVTE